MDPYKSCKLLPPGGQRGRIVRLRRVAQLPSVILLVKHLHKEDLCRRKKKYDFVKDRAHIFNIKLHQIRQPP